MNNSTYLYKFSSMANHWQCIINLDILNRKNVVFLYFKIKFGYVWVAFIAIKVSI